MIERWIVHVYDVKCDVKIVSKMMLKCDENWCVKRWCDVDVCYDVLPTLQYIDVRNDDNVSKRDENDDKNEMKWCVRCVF